MNKIPKKTKCWITKWINELNNEAAQQSDDGLYCAASLPSIEIFGLQKNDSKRQFKKAIQKDETRHLAAFLESQFT